MPRIIQMYAWIIADTEPDDEGIIAIHLPNGMTMPLVGGDRARMESFRNYAQGVATAKGNPVMLRVFGTGVEIDRVEP